MFPLNPKQGFKAFESTTTVAPEVSEQPFASTTVTEYVPIHKLETVGVFIIPPFDHWYVYGAVPPTAVTETDPSHTFVPDVGVLPQKIENPAHGFAMFVPIVKLDVDVNPPPINNRLY
jgi:hypothetical protein